MKPLVLVPQHFGSMVFDRRTSRYLPFDHEATTLLIEASRSTLGEHLARLDDEEREVAEAFVSDLYGRGFFTTDLRFAGDVREVTPPENHLTGPLAVHLEVVAACNLTCSHCFAGELPRKESPLTLNELDSLFATMSRIGSFRLGLTGGEPLMRRDLIEIVDLALSHGLHPCLTTNALLMTESIAKELGRRELVWLNVSLDGATAETNDTIRGSGTYDRVREKLTMLGRHARFTLAFTVMRTNLHEIRDCARLAAEVGAHTAVFRPLYPVGVAERSLDLMPSFDEYQRALDDLDGVEVSGSRRDLEIRSIDPFGPHTRAEEQAAVFSNHGCGAGNTVCSISVGGDVNPCSFLGNGFVADNLRRRSFEEIWHDSQVFRSMRGEPGDGTGTATFGGGCRARSLVLAGSANAPDPWIEEHDRRPADRPARHPLMVLEPRKRMRA